jgi:formate dehydrogenase maturation protein FdhE
MPYVERNEFDQEYWRHAHAALSEGFCPDCGQPIASRTLTGADGRFVPELVCTPCETEWLTVPGAPHPARFRSLESILRERGDR